MSVNRIFLVGLPGTGKSYFGKILAKELDVLFIDLDQEIEQNEKRQIKDIFSEHGEEYFREIESENLRKILNDHHAFVLATGGGTPCYHNGMEWMRQQGVVLHLETNDEILQKRLSESNDRPLVQTDVSKTILMLRNKRDVIYQKAHLTIAHRDIGTVLKELNKH